MDGIGPMISAAWTPAALISTSAPAAMVRLKFIGVSVSSVMVSISLQNANNSLPTARWLGSDGYGFVMPITDFQKQMAPPKRGLDVLPLASN